MSGQVKRQYDSSRRKEQARETQRAVLRAAHDLFVEQGYGRTTIADIARAAGVSAETIYATFKNKATLLHRVWDVTIGGDDEDVVFHERPEIMAIRAEPDLAKRFMMHARMSTATARRMTPLRLAVLGAAGSEPAAADMLAEMDRQRLAGMTVMAAASDETGQLAVSEEECRDVVWAMTDGLLWHAFVNGRGWSDEEYAEWVGRVWVATLVRPKTRRS
ncbi:MAG: TetR family transcriptional regulator [Jatrophihabitans sp.]|uniref:TetR family transcriptional regulator n=1 Tax=Jatrophihabitans sp. TaxID=1932789 RepID=UPI003912B83C